MSCFRTARLTLPRSLRTLALTLTHRGVRNARFPLWTATGSSVRLHGVTVMMLLVVVRLRCCCDRKRECCNQEDSKSSLEHVVHSGFRWRDGNFRLTRTGSSL